MTREEFDRRFDEMERADAERDADGAGLESQRLEAKRPNTG